MISGGSSSCSASAGVATMSCVSTAISPCPLDVELGRRARCWRGRSGRRWGRSANQPSRISASTGSEVVRRLSASTFASFHVRAPRAVSASAHSAARTPGDLVRGDRGAGARPAADDALVRLPFRHVPRGALACPCPVVALAVCQRAVRDRARARACAARRAAPARTGVSMSLATETFTGARI